MYPDPKRARYFGLIDAIVIAVLLAAIYYLYYRTSDVLAYRWDWSTAHLWIWRVDEATGRGEPGLLLSGLLVTLRLALWAMLIAATLGVILGAMRTSRRLFPQLVAGTYVGLIRNIPPLVFIFVFYFFISSQLLPSMDLAGSFWAAWLTLLVGPPELLDNLVSGILCLAMFEAAYIAEIVRAGIATVPKGQYEAARSIGLSRLQGFRYVVMPQALRTTLPPLASQFIMLVKNSAIISLISVQELTFSGQELANSSRKAFETWIVVALLYFIVCFSLSRLFAWMERRGLEARGR